MDKSNPPTTFGVFKPVGHTLIAFRTEGESAPAQTALLALGFSASDIVHYTAAEMGAQVASELAAASPIANFGYEIDLIHVHGQLAENGCCFLVVSAPDDEHAERVANLVKTLRPASAQHYGTFLIRDLTEKSPGT